jgi:outer membrane receptor protein involved in Fe transport
MTNSKLRRAVRLGLTSGFAASAALASAAIAQEQAADEEMTTVVVTGSRISTPNLESISPVSTITEEDIANTGKIRVEDIVNQLPQAFAAQGANYSNGSTGSANVDLRGLGAKRTLVLINGRRLMPGNADTTASSVSGAADLNQIPAALIKRVEVLTGGASATYGADAVAGVVNFIMDTRFQGVRIDANYNFNNHKNDNKTIEQIVRDTGFALPSGTVNTGYSKDFSFLAGSNFADDKGNATFYATYRNVDAVLQGKYDFSACTLNSGDSFQDAGCGGSLTSYPGRFRPLNPAPGGTRVDLFLDPTTGLLRPTDGDPSGDGVSDLYNYGPLNYYQRPDERYTAGAFTDYEVSAKADVYAEFMFMSDRSVSQIAPSGAFGVAAVVHCNNPLWTADEKQQFCGQFGLDTSPASTDTVNIAVNRRNVDGGGRQDDITHESYRAVVGVRGDLSDAWKYDIYGHYGTSQLSAVYLNDMSNARIANALDAIPDGNGGAVCASGAPGCVPWDVWQVGQVTQAQLNYVQIPLVKKGQTTERVLDASVTGDLAKYGVKLPTADDGMYVNFGVEYRSEDSELLPDAAFQAGDGAGQGGATLPVSGYYNTKELFTELRLPLVQDKAFAKSMSLEAGYRYSDYNLGFNTNTYKAGLEWTPVDDIRVRASYQRAVRVPGPTELFSAQQVALDGTVDPCAGPTPGLTLEQCARTGVTAAEYGNITANPAAQYNGFIGGNPDIQPETADTYSFGVALQPRFIPNLRFQVDYFDIKISDAIQNPNADFTLALCARTGDPLVCGRIHRDQSPGAGGTLWETTGGFVVDTFQNIGGLHNSGIDFDVSYRFDMGNAGKMALGLNGSYLSKAETTPQPGATYDCAGLYGGVCGVPASKWRHRVTASWSTPWNGLDVNLAWRHFDAVKRDLEDSNEWLAFLGTATGVLATDSKLGSRDYLDLTAGMTLKERYTLRLGISNLLDKDPPLNGSSTCPTGPCNGNTWAQVYDTLGRQIFGSVQVSF